MRPPSAARRSLQPAQPAELGEHLLRRLVADMAGVEDHHVGALRHRRRRVAERRQHIGHPRAVIHVHLAAPGDDVQTLRASLASVLIDGQRNQTRAGRSGQAATARIRLLGHSGVWQEVPSSCQLPIKHRPARPSASSTARRLRPAGSAAASRRRRPPPATPRATGPCGWQIAPDRPADAAGHVTRSPRCWAKRQKCDAMSMSPYQANTGRLARPVGGRPAGRTPPNRLDQRRIARPRRSRRTRCGTAARASRPRWCPPGTAARLSPAASRSRIRSRSRPSGVHAGAR